MSGQEVKTLENDEKILLPPHPTPTHTHTLPPSLPPYPTHTLIQTLYFFLCVCVNQLQLTQVLHRDRSFQMSLSGIGTDSYVNFYQGTKEEASLNIHNLRSPKLMTYDKYMYCKQIDENKEAEIQKILRYSDSLTSKVVNYFPR